MSQPFVYSISGYTYRLRPVFHFTGTHHIRVDGAELYSLYGARYFGYWPRENIPLNVIRALEKYCRSQYTEHAVEINSEGKYRTQD